MDEYMSFKYGVGTQPGQLYELIQFEAGIIWFSFIWPNFQGHQSSKSNKPKARLLPKHLTRIWWKISGLYIVCVCDEFTTNSHWKWNNWCTLQWIFHQPAWWMITSCIYIDAMSHIVGFCLRLRQGAENHWSMVVCELAVTLTEVRSQFKYRSNISGCGDNEHEPIEQSDTGIWWKITGVQWSDVSDLCEFPVAIWKQYDEWLWRPLDPSEAGIWQKITGAWWYANHVIRTLMWVHSSNMEAI